MCVLLGYVAPFTLTCLILWFSARRGLVNVPGYRFTYPVFIFSAWFFAHFLEVSYISKWVNDTFGIHLLREYKYTHFYIDINFIPAFFVYFLTILFVDLLLKNSYRSNVFRVTIHLCMFTVYYVLYYMFCCYVFVCY